MKQDERAICCLLLCCPSCRLGIPCFLPISLRPPRRGPIAGFAAVVGRRTLSRSLWALGLQHQDWSADYKLHARARWDPNALFQPVLERAAPLCPGPFSGDGPGRHPHPQDRPQDYVGFLPARSALTEVPLQSDVGPSFSPREFTGAPVPVFSRCFTALLAAPLSRSSGSEKARQESHRRAT